jgi:predicted TIM-barrel fold metal-dependent hydrolase
MRDMVRTTIDADWMISVDDHVVEPADLWSSRLPSRLASAGPRVERFNDEQVWIFGEKKKPIAEQGARLFSKEGMRDLLDIPKNFDDLRPGCYDPRERVKDMDAANVSASLCFPSFPRFAGQEFLETPDHSLALDCVRVYNDWMIDEWCAAVPGRLIPLVIVPLWDVDLARREIERTAAKGAKAFTFPENPYKLGLPSIYDKDRYWEPLLRTAAERNMPACTHIGSSSTLPQSSPDASIEAALTLLPINLMTTMIDWIFSGVFIRTPELKLCLSEGGVGWIPYALERCDHSFHQRESAFIRARNNGLEHLVDYHDLDRLPSEVFAEHVFACLLDEPFGSTVLDRMPLDNVMVEVDYPHADTSWPRSPGVIGEQLSSLSAEQRYEVLQGNARRVFDFAPSVG